MKTLDRLRIALLILAAAAFFADMPSQCFAGAVDGPHRYELEVGYYTHNTKQVKIEFEGGKEARIMCSSTVCGYGVLYGPDFKGQSYRRFETQGMPAGRCGAVAIFTPEKRSSYTIQVINDDNNAKKDAKFLIETN